MGVNVLDRTSPPAPNWAIESATMTCAKPSPVTGLNPDMADSLGRRCRAAPRPVDKHRSEPSLNREPETPADAGKRARSPATELINPSDRYDQVSKLYVEAIAHKLGWEVRHPALDRSGTDISLLTGGKILTPIDIQCKGTVRPRPRSDGSIGHAFKRDQYDLYRRERAHPFWVVLFTFRDDPSNCITFDQSGFRIDCAAYYSDPADWNDSSNRYSVTVRFDPANRFCPSALESLVSRLSGG